MASPSAASPPVREVPGKAQTTPKDKAGPVKVQATDMGYYDHVRRRPGDVFVIDAADFSPKWMVRVEATTPEHVTTAQQALTQQHRDTVAGRAAPPLTGTDRDVL